MELHPIVKRVLQFKLGETKLSAAAEKALATRPSVRFAMLIKRKRFQKRPQVLSPRYSL